MFSKKELFSLIKGPVDTITYKILYNYLTSDMTEASCFDEGWNLTEEEVDDLNFRGIYLEGDRWVGPKDEYDCFYKDYDEIELELLHIECKIVLCYLNSEDSFCHRIKAPIILPILSESGYRYNQLVANCIYNIKLN